MSSSLLSSHLEQISLCASSIDELQFPGPKAFTNALLAPHDITALIRDTEPHERALFSIAPPPVPSKTQIHQFSSAVSASVNSAQPRPGPTSGPIRPPRRHTAVAAVLGGDMYRRIRTADDSGEQSHGYGRSRDKAEVDVDLLLHGAEKLVSVYPIPGAHDRIARLRNRYTQLTANIAHYEGRVASQASQLNHMSQPREYDDYYETEVAEEGIYYDHSQPAPSASTPQMTAEDLRLEEEEIRALERKKKALEERVTGMEKDIGGLLR